MHKRFHTGKKKGKKELHKRFHTGKKKERKGDVSILFSNSITLLLERKYVQEVGMRNLRYIVNSKTGILLNQS